MKRRREGNHETSTSPARLRHSGSSTGDINIPLDLTVEILKKLPAKSLVRFQCVSKLWSSIISRRRDFIESIVTRSPRDAYLLSYHVSTDYDNAKSSLVLSSSSCTRNTEKKSLLLPHGCYQYVRGLIFCWTDCLHEPYIYNPTTRQSFQLPKLRNYGMGDCLFGYDPLENQYKVLFLPSYYMEQGCQVFTLGDPRAKQWRLIQGVESHFPMSDAVCINGTIYYRGKATYCGYGSLYKLMSFDVRSEELCHVDAPETLMDHKSFLIDYQGKLGFVCCHKGVEIWARGDGDQKIQVWSKIFFYDMEGFEKWYISGVTRDGEIVFVDFGYGPDDPLCVLCYDPKQNSVRDVDLEGAWPGRRNSVIIIWFFQCFVENTMGLY